MNIEEAKGAAMVMLQAFADVITVSCPVASPVSQEDAARVFLKMEERGYSMVPTDLIVKSHELTIRNNKLSLELREKQDYNNKQKDTIIRGQAARIAQLEEQLGIEKEEVQDKNPPIMWVSRESA